MQISVWLINLKAGIGVMAMAAKMAKHG